LSNSQIAEAVSRQEKRLLADIRKNEVAKRARAARDTGRMAFSVEEVAAALDKDMTTVWRWIRTGKLRAVKIGGSRMIPAAELDRVLQGGAAPKSEPDPKPKAKRGQAQ
jgi:excisionase family DNA binding protein